jgi:cell division protein FtsB
MRRVIALLLIGALIGVFTWRTLEIRHLRRELRQLESEKAQIQKEIESLSERLRAISDLKLVEYFARKELGMVKPGEELYILIEDGESER